MKIISLNVNNFGGRSKNKKRDCNNVHYKWEQVVCENQYEKILEFSKAYDVLIFQEYDYNSVQGKKLSKALKDKGYTPIWMSDFNKYVHPSITIVFTKEKSIDRNDVIHDSTQYHLRSALLELENLIILGTHRPCNKDYGDKFWDELIEFYDKILNSQNKNLVLIGDMNINIKLWRKSRELYCKLTDKGAIDKGKDEDKLTHYEDGIPRRIDYAFVSKNLDEKCTLYTTPCRIGNEEILSVIEQDISDHEAIILDII